MLSPCCSTPSLKIARCSVQKAFSDNHSLSSPTRASHRCASLYKLLPQKSVRRPIPALSTSTVMCPNYAPVLPRRKRSLKTSKCLDHFCSISIQHGAWHTTGAQKTRTWMNKAKSLSSLSSQLPAVLLGGEGHLPKARLHLCWLAPLTCPLPLSLLAFTLTRVCRQTRKTTNPHKHPSFSARHWWANVGWACYFGKDNDENKRDKNARYHPSQVRAPSVWRQSGGDCVTEEGTHRS